MIQSSLEYDEKEKIPSALDFLFLCVGNLLIENSLALALSCYFFDFSCINAEILQNEQHVRGGSKSYETIKTCPRVNQPVIVLWPPRSSSLWAAAPLRVQFNENETLGVSEVEKFLRERVSKMEIVFFWNGN